MSFLKRFFGTKESRKAPASEAEGCRERSDTFVLCEHCHESFDFQKAVRESGDYGDWIICPHCQKQSKDNIHPDCPYWQFWSCRHDRRHPTRCSLPTKSPYETCALL